MAKKKLDKEKIAEKLDQVPEQKIKPQTNSVAKTPEAIKLSSAMNWLNENYDFRYNVSSNELEYRKKNDKYFITLDEYDCNGIKNKLSLFGGVTLSKLHFDQIILSEYVSSKYDPLKEYIFSLPKWNGKTDYIKEFLNQVYLKNEEDREYFIKGFTKWFVALVMSLIEDTPDPYHINQVALILVSSGQGKHKTTWLGSIVPEILRLKYYYPSSFNAHNKDHEKYLATKILINLDEMSSFNKTDIETMKSKITQPQVVLRLPYGRADIHVKRRASFCGSINDRQFLRDETGSRRWLVIEIDDIKYEKDFDVSKMYAQALAMYKNGFEFWFDGDFIGQMEIKNNEYSQPTMEEELLLLYFKPAAKDVDYNNELKPAEYLTTSEIAQKIAEKNQRMNINGSVLRSLGKALTKHKFFRKGIKIKETKTTLYCWKVFYYSEGNYKEAAGDNSNKNNDVI